MKIRARVQQVHCAGYLSEFDRLCLTVKHFLNVQAVRAASVRDRAHNSYVLQRTSKFQVAALQILARNTGPIINV
jgi:hypothetical protein